jgi:cytochrome o ubiquinol oxidase operon protein cyoD
MNTPMNEFNPKTYFEDIGAWPTSSKGVHRMAIPYVTGFILSLIITFLAYHVVIQHALSPQLLVVAIVALAALQFIVQMVCFLHMGTQTSSRDRLIVLGFAGVIVTILVAGSLWIINNLNNRMMPTTAQMEQYMSDQTGI